MAPRTQDDIEPDWTHRGLASGGDHWSCRLGPIEISVTSTSGADGFWSWELWDDEEGELATGEVMSKGDEPGAHGWDAEGLAHAGAAVDEAKRRGWAVAQALHVPTEDDCARMGQAGQAASCHPADNDREAMITRITGEQ